MLFLGLSISHTFYHSSTENCLRHLNGITVIMVQVYDLFTLTRSKYNKHT
jgi:hypothetical protein